MSRRRLSNAERTVIDLLRYHPTKNISYDDMAAQVGYDRRTLISAVTRLCTRQYLVKQVGSGTRPNMYTIL
jgi:DNA-binding GntR family transcriptional regulator